ncbi:MAG: hypothetical protein INQ03_02840 [Candidatus Heimdallarchaeota archaeon]|nr:hypothetical protein [Candidatus Heimdallarchaeota archaeon]
MVNKILIVLYSLLLFFTMVPQHSNALIIAEDLFIKGDNIIYYTLANSTNLDNNNTYASITPNYENYTYNGLVTIGSKDLMNFTIQSYGVFDVESKEYSYNEEIELIDPTTGIYRDPNNPTRELAGRTRLFDPNIDNYAINATIDMHLENTSMKIISDGKWIHPTNLNYQVDVWYGIMYMEFILDDYEEYLEYNYAISKDTGMVMERILAITFHEYYNISTGEYQSNNYLQIHTYLDFEIPDYLNGPPISIETEYQNQEEGWLSDVMNLNYPLISLILLPLGGWRRNIYCTYRTI